MSINTCLWLEREHSKYFGSGEHILTLPLPSRSAWSIGRAGACRKIRLLAWKELWENCFSSVPRELADAQLKPVLMIPDV